MIYLASDHAGFELKHAIGSFLQQVNIEYIDMGPHQYDPADDYPDFIIPAVQKVARESGAKGIVLGGSGQGEAIAANKVPGIRAALYYGGPEEIITLSRTHNDANVLSLGARFLDRETTIKVIESWLATDFSYEVHHARRIGKISEFESK